MRAILIDTEDESVSEIEIDTKLDGYGYQHWINIIGTDKIHHAYSYGTRDMSIVTRKEDDDTLGRFIYDGKFESCGKSLIVGVDGYGEPMACVEPVDRAMSDIKFFKSKLMQRESIIDLICMK